MDWSNERYVRLYCSDTKSWLKLGWEGQAVFALLLRKVDRSGMLDDVRDGEDVALMLGSGFPVDIAEIGLRRLCKKGTAVITENGLLLPNFIEAQETPKSDRRRQRDSREAKRAKASVTKRDILSRAVTQSHGESQSVTLTCADPVLCCADPLPMQNKNKNPKTPKGAHGVTCTDHLCTSKSKNGYSQDFENFWSCYPRRVGKGPASKAFERAKKAGLPDHLTVAIIIEKHKKGAAWLDDNGKYIPHPATWLNQRRWEDDVEPYKPKTGKTQQEMDKLRRQRNDRIAREQKCDIGHDRPRFPPHDSGVSRESGDF